MEREGGKATPREKNLAEGGLESGRGRVSNKGTNGG